MMDNLSLALQGGWKVLFAALVLGAGLPAVFALGVRSVAWGSAGGMSGDSDAESQGKPLGRVLGAVCFAIVVLGVVLGISIIVAAGFGKQVSFEHVVPTFVDKK